MRELRPIAQVRVQTDYRFDYIFSNEELFGASNVRTVVGLHAVKFRRRRRGGAAVPQLRTRPLGRVEQVIDGKRTVVIDPGFNRDAARPFPVGAGCALSGRSPSTWDISRISLTELRQQNEQMTRPRPHAFERGGRGLSRRSARD